MLRMETSGEPSLSALLASAPSSHRGHVGLILIEPKLYETEIRRDHAGPRAGCGIAMDGRARGAAPRRKAFRWLHRSQGARLDQGLPKGSYGTERALFQPAAFRCVLLSRGLG